MTVGLRLNPSLHLVSAATRLAALSCEVPRHRVDAELVEATERTCRLASATLGLPTPPKVRWLPPSVRDVRGVVFDERPDEIWVKQQDLAATRNSVLHELRHSWGLTAGRYEALGMHTMAERQHDADDFARRWTPSQEMKSSDGQRLLHKAGGRLAVKAAADGWEIQGYASSFANVPDAYNDVIAKGAFSRTIRERETRFLFEHATPIGKQIEIREDDTGLFGRWSIVDTQAGTDARKLALANVCQGLSIGYVPRDSEQRADGVRVLKDIDLYEVSLVAIPAQPLATVTAVKHVPEPERIDIRAELARRRARIAAR